MLTYFIRARALPGLAAASMNWSLSLWKMLNGDASQSACGTIDIGN